MWTKILTSDIKPGNSDTVISFSVPVHATNLMFEFQEYTSDSSDSYSSQAASRAGHLYGEAYEMFLGKERDKVPTFSTDKREDVICPRCNI